MADSDGEERVSRLQRAREVRNQQGAEAAKEQDLRATAAAATASAPITVGSKIRISRDDKSSFRAVVSYLDDDGAKKLPLITATSLTQQRLPGKIDALCGEEEVSPLSQPANTVTHDG